MCDGRCLQQSAGFQGVGLFPTRLVTFPRPSKSYDEPYEHRYKGHMVFPRDLAVVESIAFEVGI